jgi:hypothetical protein
LRTLYYTFAKRVPFIKGGQDMTEVILLGVFTNAALLVLALNTHQVERERLRVQERIEQRLDITAQQMEHVNNVHSIMQNNVSSLSQTVEQQRFALEHFKKKDS